MTITRNMHWIYNNDIASHCILSRYWICWHLLSSLSFENDSWRESESETNGEDSVSTLFIGIPLRLKKEKRSRNFQQIITFFCAAAATTTTPALTAETKKQLLFEIILCTSDSQQPANILFMSAVAACDNSNNVDVVSKVTIICVLTCQHTMWSHFSLLVFISSYSLVVVILPFAASNHRTPSAWQVYFSIIMCKVKWRGLFSTFRSVYFHGWKRIFNVVWHQRCASMYILDNTDERKKTLWPDPC